MSDTGDRRKVELVQYPDKTYRCVACDWEGPAHEVNWGVWFSAGEEFMTAKAEKSDCPKCATEVEAI